MYAGAAGVLGLGTPFTDPFCLGTSLGMGAGFRRVLLQARHVKSTADQSRFGLPASSSARSWHVVLWIHMNIPFDQGTDKGLLGPSTTRFTLNQLRSIILSQGK